MSTSGVDASIGGYLYSQGGINDRHDCYLGGYLYSEGGINERRTGYLGGYLSAAPGDDSSQYGILGGYLKSETVTNVPIAYLGGIVWAAETTTRSAEIGGHTVSYSGLSYVPVLGGYLPSRPGISTFVDAKERALIKAFSDDVDGQELSIDAQIIFKQLGQKEFYAQFINANTYTKEFGAKLQVQRWKILPTVIIQSAIFDNGIESGQINNLDPDGNRTLTLVASGTLGDGDSWIYATIDFGDPQFTSPIRHNISGFLTGPTWTASHTYSTSGIYNVVVKAVDNYGFVGSDSLQVNLASGLVAGVDYPYVSISGAPRSGHVPPNLHVDFTTAFSGVGSTTKTSTNNAIWDFGNGQYSRTINPTAIYTDPGMYTPIFRYRYTNLNGQVIYVSDTLRLGYNI